MRELSVRLHRVEQPGELLSELIRWAENYTPTRPPTWESVGEHPTSAVAAPNPHAPTPKPTGRRRPRLTPNERLVRAVAELAQRNGYPQVTVADIAATAGVNRETFYQHFTDKQSAYIAALQLAFARTMAATAGHSSAAPTGPSASGTAHEDWSHSSPTSVHSLASPSPSHTPSAPRRPS